MSKRAKITCSYCGQDGHYDENVVCDRMIHEFPLPLTLNMEDDKPKEEPLIDNRQIKMLQDDILSKNNEIMSLGALLDQKTRENELLVIHNKAMQSKVNNSIEAVKKSGKYKTERDDYRDLLEKLLFVIPKISIAHKNIRKALNKHKD